MSYLQRYLFQKKQKNGNVKVFNMITNKNEAKAMETHIFVIANQNSIVQLAIQIKYGMKKHVNVSVKTIVNTKKIIVGILAHVFVRMIGILKNC